MKNSKLFFLIIFAVSHCPAWCQTFIEAMANKKHKWTIDVNICELKVRDSLELIPAEKGMTFKLINKHKCKLKDKGGVKLCGDKRVEDVKWVVKSKRKKGLTMIIKIDGKKIFVRDRKVVKIK